MTTLGMNVSTILLKALHVKCVPVDRTLLHFKFWEQFGCNRNVSHNDFASLFLMLCGVNETEVQPKSCGQDNAM